MHPYIHELVPLVSSGRALSRPDADKLVPLLGEHLPDILALARLSASAGNAEPFICGIVSAKSGRCPEDCAFCAQSARYGTGAPAHELLDTDALLRQAEAFAAKGARYMGIVISGTAPSAGDFDRLCEDAAVIRARVNIGLCASLGLLDAGQARALKQAGFASCHHNLETAPSHYGRICSTHGIESRLETVRRAREAGLRVCSGGIFGMGESWSQRLELAEVLGGLEVDAMPINFLNPIPGTPLDGSDLLSPQEALACVALFRLMHPGRDVVICGGRTKTLGEWENMLFSAGANAMITGDYLTTEGSPPDRDLAMLAVLGIKL